MLRCALITNDDDVRSGVNHIAHTGSVPSEIVADLPAFAAEVARDELGAVEDSGPHVLVVDLGMEASHGLRVVHTVSKNLPQCQILAIGPALEADGILQVIRAGATEYLPRPLDAEELSEAYGRVVRKVDPTVLEEGAPEGSVYAVFGPKGGTGVTTAAVNLAVEIRRRTGDPTLLLDLSPSLGTAPVLLGLQPRYSYLEVVENFHRLDAELLDSFLQVHDSGVRLLGAPATFRPHEQLSAEKLGQLLMVLRRHFAHVVVDTALPFGPEVSHLASQADHFLVLTTPEVAALHRLKHLSEVLPRPEDPEGRGLGVVVNRFSDDAGMTLKDVEKASGLPILATFEREDEALLRSANTGVPLVLTGSSAFTKTLRGLVTDLTGVSPATRSRVDQAMSWILSPFRNTAERNGSAASTNGRIKTGSKK